MCVASSWFDHPTSKHHVMRVLSEHNHVLWINFHASRRPALSRGDAGAAWRRLRRVWAGPQCVSPQLDVLSPLLVPWPESKLARLVNTHLLVRRIRRALRRLPRRPVQLWLFTPDVPELAAALAPERVVYYCVDDFSAFSGFNAALVRELEERTVRGSDVVLATSAALFEQRARQHACTHLVPHGVDFEHFAAAPTLPADAIPAELRDLRRPVFGYMGLLSDYVDLDLISRVAAVRPDWSFVFIGDVRCDTRTVQGRDNVHLLGGRRYEDLQAYCRGMDVGLIPFRLNRLTAAVNPIKLREYLAAGLPVVSAPLPEVRAYAPAVQVADTPDGFLAAAARALRAARESPPAARQALVRDESWRARVAEISEIVMTAGAGVPAEVVRSAVG